jgi:hypothetical protein
LHITPAGEKKKQRSSNPMGISMIIGGIVSGIFGLFCTLQIRPQAIGNNIWFIPPVLGIISVILGIWLLVNESHIITILSGIVFTLVGIGFLGYTIFNVIAFSSGSKYFGGPWIISVFTFSWMLFLFKEARDFFR